MPGTSIDQLQIGSTVAIYNTQRTSKKHQHKTGTIVEILPHKQYKIKLNGSGRLTLRNRRFLHQTTSHFDINNPTPSAMVPVPLNPDTSANPTRLTTDNHLTGKTTIPHEGKIPTTLTNTSPTQNQPMKVQPQIYNPQQHLE